ncbi:hypothetical protein OG285_34105 [Streptomyces sp. NBC_01471]|uniref:hypothetical protein n=1 Tax=Streptomyces sp. NBC_01471 TaxID=2903879 RepID=UPI0032490CBC
MAVIKAPRRKNRRYRSGQLAHAVSPVLRRRQTFHTGHSSIYTTVGSTGGVDMKLGDAKKPWSVLKKNDKVYVWGRPST